MMHSISYESPDHGSFMASLMKSIVALLWYVIFPQINPIYIVLIQSGDDNFLLYCNWWKMMSCCQSNAQTAWILGIICIILNILGIILSGFGPFWENKLWFIFFITSVIVGIIFAMINGILIFGALIRNRTLILVWIILAVFEIVFYFFFAIISLVMFPILLFVWFHKDPRGEKGLIEKWN